MESHLGANEIEIGMGIHNESGHQRLSPAPPLKELVPKLLELLTSTSDSERSFLPFQGQNDSVVLLINNLGGLSELELGAVVSQVRKDLYAMGINIARVLAGAFMVREEAFVTCCLWIDKWTDESEYAWLLYHTAFAPIGERRS